MQYVGPTGHPVPYCISLWPSPFCPENGRFSPVSSGLEGCFSLFQLPFQVAEAKHVSISDLLPAMLIKGTKTSWIHLPGRCFNQEGLKLYKTCGLWGKVISLIKSADRTECGAELEGFVPETLSVLLIFSSCSGGI